MKSFLDWFLSLSNVHLRLLNVFSWLNNITCLYYHNLFIHLLRNTLLLPSFGNCESSYYKHPFPRVCPSSCPLHWWCYPTISCSVALFSCLQSFPASGSFPMSQLFASGGQSIGVSASTSWVLLMNTQDWSLLGWTGWISLKSKELSRVFSNTTVQKHQFSSTQLSSQSNSHIHTWPQEKP